MFGIIACLSMTYMPSRLEDDKSRWVTPETFVGESHGVAVIICGRRDISNEEHRRARGKLGIGF